MLKMENFNIKNIANIMKNGFFISCNFKKRYFIRNYLVYKIVSHSGSWIHNGKRKVYNKAIP